MGSQLLNHAEKSYFSDPILTIDRWTDPQSDVAIQPAFLTTSNLLNLFQQWSGVGLMAMAGTFVMIAQFSLPFAVGCMLTERALSPHHLSDATLKASNLQSAMTKVRMTTAHDPEVVDAGPEAARVKIHLKNGRVHELLCGFPTGAPQRPMSDDDVEEKFIAAVSASVDEDSARRLIATIWHLDQLPQLNTLLTVTSAPPQSRNATKSCRG